MQFTENSALQRLSDLGMDDMPVVEFVPKLCKLNPDWFQKYSTLRRDFLNSLTDSMDEIVFMNLKQDEFVNLIMGKALPENISIRLRIPLFWGGELNIDNMFLCTTFPNAYNLDRFIMEQSDAKTVFLPNPEKKIYITSHIGGGGDGGNATSDRLSQTAINNFLSGRGNE